MQIKINKKLFYGIIFLLIAAGVSLLYANIKSAVNAKDFNLVTSPEQGIILTADALLQTPINDGSEIKNGKAFYTSFNKEHFARVLGEKQKVVMLFFYADWCASCHLQEEVNRDLFGNDEEIGDLDVAAFKVDYDRETEMNRKYGISVQHITIILNKNGKMLAKLFGHQTKEQLKSAIRQVLQ